MQIKRQNTARIFEQAQCITSYRAVKILLAWMYMVKLFIASAQLLCYKSGARRISRMT